jgi:uncharacterized lipoprotein YmbA
MKNINPLLTLIAALMLASCAQTTPSADRPTLKDYDNAPGAGPLFMPFR